MQTLWHIDQFALATEAQAVQWANGIHLHLRHGPLTSILLRIGPTERAYIELAGCSGCARGRCRIGCQSELFGRLLRACAPASQLRLVARGLAARPYARVCLAWPTARATLPIQVDQQWSDLRMELHWQPGNPPRAAMLLAIGSDGPAPAGLLRQQGWWALPLPALLARRWTRSRPVGIPLAGVVPSAPVLLMPSLPTIAPVSLPIEPLTASEIVPLAQELPMPTPADLPSERATETRLLADLRAVLAGESPFRRIAATPASATTEEATGPAGIAELSPFPLGPGMGKSAMRPHDVGAWVQALLDHPQGYTRKTIAALLPEPFKEHAATLLYWLDQADLLGPATDPAQPYRYPRPLRIHDASLLADRLRATALPDAEALQSAKGRGL